VVATFVANVLPPRERHAMLVEAFSRAREQLIVAAHSDRIAGEPFADGVITSAGTSQRSYGPGELVAELRALFPGAVVEAGPRVSGASTAIVTPR
jgi:hypothetical protein